MNNLHQIEDKVECLLDPVCADLPIVWCDFCDSQNTLDCRVERVAPNLRILDRFFLLVFQRDGFQFSTNVLPSGNGPKPSSSSCVVGVPPVGAAFCV